jgi:hypothetical protein
LTGHAVQDPNQDGIIMARIARVGQAPQGCPASARKSGDSGGSGDVSKRDALNEIDGSDGKISWTTIKASQFPVSLFLFFSLSLSLPLPLLLLLLLLLLLTPTLPFFSIQVLDVHGLDGMPSNQDKDSPHSPCHGVVLASWDVDGRNKSNGHDGRNKSNGQQLGRRASNPKPHTYVGNPCVLNPRPSLRPNRPAIVVGSGSALWDDAGLRVGGVPAGGGQVEVMMKMGG